MLSTKNISSIFTFFLLWCWMSAPAQSPDSFELKIAQATGVKKAEALSDAVAFLVRSDMKRALQYVDDTYSLAKTNSDPTITAYTFLNDGVYLIAKGAYDSAILLIQKANSIA